MKTHNLKNDIFSLRYIIRLLFISIILLTTYSLNAQDKQEIWETKGKKGTFIGYGSHKGKSRGKFILYHNSKYDIDELRKNRNPVSINEFYLYRINSHEIFLSAFKKVFSPEQIKELASNEELIKISFLLDEKGQIMSIDYMVYTNSTISVFELEKLEYELLNNITFSTTNPIEPNSYGLYSIRTTFEQIINGEIIAIRKNEEMTKEYFQ